MTLDPTDQRPNLPGPLTTSQHAKLVGACVKAQQASGVSGYDALVAVQGEPVEVLALLVDEDLGFNPFTGK